MALIKSLKVQATRTPEQINGQPPHPWPSEIAAGNRQQPGQDLGKSDGQEHGHDDGHSM
jgi:hypothetical protein